MLIAQITDMHVRASGAEPTLGVNNNANLQAAVELLQAMTPKPDVVLATGDLTNRGQREEYDALHALLLPLRIPLYLIPGNHDDHGLLRETFTEHAYLAATTDFLHYVVDDYAVRLIGVDTTLSERHDGALCADRLHWLSARLAQAPSEPTLIFMHHPPFRTGIWWVDGIGLLEGKAAFEQLVAAHPQVKLITCGHVHRPVQSLLGRTPVNIAPSTAHQVLLDVVPESPPRFIAEPPALQLHHWNGSAFVSHLAYLGGGPEPVDLRRFMDWDKRRELVRRGEGTPKRVEY